MKNRFDVYFLLLIQQGIIKGEFKRQAPLLKIIFDIHYQYILRFFLAYYSKNKKLILELKGKHNEQILINLKKI